MTVTALAPLPTFEVEAFPSSDDDPGTVTYAVDDGTVTVIAPALPAPADNVAPAPEPVGDNELPVASSAVDVATRTELVVAPLLLLALGSAVDMDEVVWEEALVEDCSTWDVGSAI